MQYRSVQPLLLTKEESRCVATILRKTFDMGKRMGACCSGDSAVVISREDLDANGDGVAGLYGTPTLRTVTIE